MASPLLPARPVPQPLLSLCMIVRDEETNLPRCIESVRAYVDEIVVADTGSRDATAAVARRLGARVFSHPWRDDFAEARNAALRAARGAYALVVDADEWLEEAPPPEAFRRWLARCGEEALTVEIVDRAGGRPCRRYPLVRLFRCRPEYRYRGAIHEQIVPAIAARLGAASIAPRASGLVVGHDGYDPRTERLAAKRERNLKLLRDALRARPADPALRFFVVRELVPLVGNRAVPGLRLRDAAGELQALEEGLLRLSPPLAVEAVRWCAAARLGEGRLELARRLLGTSDDRGAALELLRSDLEAQGGRPGLERAAARALACAERPARDGGLVSEPGLVTTIAPARAAEFLLALGKLERAERALQKALAADEGGAAPWIVAAALARRRGRPLEALRAYAQGLRRDPADPWAWCGCGELLLEVGRTEEAIEPLARALRIAPGWDRPERALAQARRHATI